MSIAGVYLGAAFNEALGIATISAIVYDGAPEASHFWSLVRTDANGTRTVRLPDGYTLIGDSGSGTYSLNVTDHELALSGLVTYTFVVEGETGGPWERTASFTPSTERKWLTFPILPQYSLELPEVGDYGTAWEPRDTILDIIDRDDPLPVFGRFGLRSGTFSILAPDYAAGLAIVTAYKRIRIAMLRVPDPAAVTMYHTVTNLSMRRHAPQAAEWVVEGDYREVASPTGPQMGTLGWAWEDVTALGLTWDELRLTYDTWADLTLGPA